MLPFASAKASRGVLSRAFTDTDMSAGFFGFFDLTTNAARRAFTVASTTQQRTSAWDGFVWGTACTLFCGGSATPFAWSIDDGPWVTATFPTGSTGTFPVFSGLPDGPHMVRLKGLVSTASFTNVAGTVLTVYGSNPKITFPNMGTKWMVTDASFPGVHLFPLTARPAGANVVPANSDTSYGTASYPFGASVKFRATCSEIWAFTDDTEATIFIDGSATAKHFMQDQINLNKWRVWKQVARNLDSTTEHEYILAFGNVNPTGQSFGCPLGIALDSAGVFGTTAATKKWVQYGDSITEASGTGGTGAVNDDGDLYRTCAALGFLGVMVGQTGKKAADIDTSLTYLRGLRAITEDVAILAIGRNDAATTSAAFKTSITNILTALKAASVPKILVRGTCIGGTSGGVTARDTDLSDAVTAFGDATVHYLSTLLWTGVEGVAPNNPPSDGTHPTPVGYVTMSGYEVTDYAPYV